jgi:DNA-binding NarL/FixJ family response regulator
LASVLSLAGSGAHEFACISNLAEYRVWRRQHRADLILVELMRNQANGFSLAAALARQSAQPVVLLSDRRLASDALWAAARGIRQVLSRCAGTAALAEQLRQLINPVETPGPLWSFEQADQQQAPVPPLRGYLCPAARITRCATDLNPEHHSERQPHLPDMQCVVVFTRGQASAWRTSVC